MSEWVWVVTGYGLTLATWLGYAWWSGRDVGDR
ncbi:hypothetical protein BH23ACT10_BH23ACT10_25330 [soil metagenome]